MASAPRPDNEAARLAALRRLQVLDSPTQSEFDALLRARQPLRVQPAPQAAQSGRAQLS